MLERSAGRVAGYAAAASTAPLCGYSIVGNGAGVNNLAIRGVIPIHGATIDDGYPTTIHTRLQAMSSVGMSQDVS